MIASMDDLARMIKSFPAGKRVRNSLYIHLECIAIYDADLALVVEKLRHSYSVGPHFNVLKAGVCAHRLSFLEYADFFTDPHPRLLESVRIDLARDKVGRRNHYANSKNPPILHRKETLVGPKHESYPSWKAMTEEEESAGLYENPKTIGFKANWDSLLSQKGLVYSGHKLIKTGSAIDPGNNKQAPEVHRHKTAIKRYGFSRPIQTVLEYGLLNKGQSLLDYGCGKGDDVKQLKALGHNVYGWDPVHPSDSSKIPADIVNLGFVLNVIEDTVERTEVLNDAYSLCKKLLVVSTIVASSSTQGAVRPYRDGILTSRSTFQKYFRQEELKQYIEDTLDTPTVATGPGIFYIFRRPSDHQEFLANRTRRTTDWLGQTRPIRLPKAPGRSAKKPDIYESNGELLNAFWSRMLDLGRPPIKEEFDRYDELQEAIGSVNKARNLFQRKFGPELLIKAFEIRRGDLLVYMALSNFRRPVPFQHLPPSIRTDIKTFLGGYRQAIEKSLKLLFSIGNSEIIAELCDQTPFGFLDEQALYIHSGLLKNLHPILRTYVGCAELLAGDINNFDLIKLHKRSGKVSLTRYDDFENNPLPVLVERVKVDLSRQKVDIFDHGSSQRQEVLFFKERYIAEAKARQTVSPQYQSGRSSDCTP